MFRRIVLTALLASSLALSGANAAVEPPRTGAVGGGILTDRCGGFPPLETLFRFGTGARPAAPAAVAPDGKIYVGTSDGYVHALGVEGGYRWSYTLAGAVVGRAVVGHGGTLLVPTLRRIYAIRPNGSLLWVFNSPVPVLSDLVRDGIGRYHFTSDAGRLFALSGRGGLVAHVPGPGRFSSPPVALPDGAIGVGRVDGRVLISRPGKNQHFKTEGSRVSAVLPCGSSSVCAIAGGVLASLESASIRMRARRASSNGEFLAVLSAETRLELYGASQDRLFSLDLPGPASSEPVVDGRGRTFVGLRSGLLLQVSALGAISGCTSLGHTPLGTPVLDPERRRVLVTLSEGVLAAVGAR